jgi:hypothetical protein
MLVTLVSFPKDIEGECRGFPMVPEENFISNFLVLLEGAPQTMGTFII